MGIAWAACFAAGMAHYDLANAQLWVIGAVVALIAVRTVSDKYNYQEIAVDELAPGMILSTASTLMLMSSTVKGLPPISSEDLRSRLSQNEVESIIRWSKTSNGKSSLVIVRKIPFAIFIAVGSIAFIVLELVVS